MKCLEERLKELENIPEKVETLEETVAMIMLQLAEIQAERGASTNG